MSDQANTICDIDQAAAKSGNGAKDFAADEEMSPGPGTRAALLKDPRALRAACWRRRRCICCCCCCSGCCTMLLCAIMALAFTASLGKADEAWRKYLDAPPAQALTEAENLISRANYIAGNLTVDAVAMKALPKELDLVCSGGGLLSMYFLGAHQVLAALQRRKATSLHRMSGSSGGAEAAFRLALVGDEERVAAQNFAYAQVQAENPGDFDSFVKAVLCADHHWRLLATWLLDKYAANRTRLDGVMYTSVTTYEPFPTNKLVSRYDSRDRAWEAFVMTGSFFMMPDAVTKTSGTYDGKLAADGGATDCTPHFSDGARMQFVVLLINSGLDMDMVSGRYDLGKAIHAMRKGQDDFAAFLRAGGSGSDAMLFQREDKSWSACDCNGNFSDEELGAAAIFAIILCIVVVLCCCPFAGYKARQKYNARAQARQQGQSSEP